MAITRIGNYHSYIGTEEEFNAADYSPDIPFIDNGSDLWLYDVGRFLKYYDGEWRPYNIQIGDGKGVPLDVTTSIQTMLGVTQMLSAILSEIREIKEYILEISE